MQLGAQFLETRASLKNRHKPAVANNWVSKLFHVFIKKKNKTGEGKDKAHSWREAVKLSFLIFGNYLRVAERKTH